MRRRSRSKHRRGLLSRLFSPISSAQFMREYWPNRLLVNHGSLARINDLRRSPPLRTIGDLLDAYHSRGLNVRVLSKAGESQLPANQAGMWFWKAECSLGFNGVDRVVPAAAEYIRKLSREVQIPLHFIDCHAYASRGRSAARGLSAHFDNHEVIIVQVLGRKRWKLAPVSGLRWPPSGYNPSVTLWHAEIAAYTPAGFPEPPNKMSTVDLEAGSALFVPRGYWHTTSAIGDDSLSLTFGFNIPSWHHLFWKWARAYTAQYPLWRSPAVQLWRSDSASKATAHKTLSALRERLLSDLQALDIDWTLRALAESGDTPVGDPADAAFDGPFYSKNPSAELAWKRRPTARLLSVTVRSGGDGQPPTRIDGMSGEALGVLEWLVRSDSECFSFQEIRRVASQIHPVNLHYLLESLVKSGYLAKLPADADGGDNRQPDTRGRIHSSFPAR